MPKHISPNAYSKKYGIPKDTVMRWALNGKIPASAIKKVQITRLFINEDYKIKKV